MKKAIKLTLAVVLMMSATSLFAQKFGRVSVQEVVVAMPETKEMQSTMEKYIKDLQDQMEALSVEINNKLQDYQKNFSTYSEAIRDMKGKELQEMQGRREEFQQIAQEDIQKKQNELLAPIYEKAKKAIDKIAAAGAYTVVFDSSSAATPIYMDSAVVADLTAAVKKDLGITDAPAAAPAAAPAKK